MRILFLFLLLCVAVLVKAQTCPPNLDFEEGDFSHWQCLAGITDTAENGRNEIILHDTTPITGRHTIISADADSTIPLDHYGKFPVLCPYGGKHSVKLGNDGSGAEAEGMSYTFTVPVTEDTFSFTYFYAVVFENPGHLDEEQPRFFVTAYEVATGQVINCASYNYVSVGGLPGFLPTDSNQTILYKAWSPSSIQFVNLGGKEVRLEFKTADCTRGGHFGYAYFDVGSGCSNILATAPYCKETNSLLLNAPYGFQYYTWYNEDFTQVFGNQQNLTLNPPPATAGRFYVDLNPYPGYGCRDTVYADVHPLPVPGMPEAQTDYFYCQNEAAVTLTATAAINSDLLWYTDTTLSPLPTAPHPSTDLPAVYTYYVSQKVLFGCESFRKPITVRIDPVPDVSFTINQPKQCLTGNQFTFTSTSSNLQDSVFIWSFGDNSIDSGTAAINHIYQQGNDYRVNLRVRNGPICYREIESPVRVVPKPLASFASPPVICQNQTSFVLTDQSSVPQNLSSVVSWRWQLQDKVIMDQNPAPFVPGEGGDFAVSLLVATDEGCLSDTTRRVIRVHYQPKASMAWDVPLCSNKTIHFTDKSSLPLAATGEALINWSWQFNSQSNAAQNPAFVLSDGEYNTSLAVQSNFGCNSVMADSFFIVNPEPVIGIGINDSCIKRSIHYTAQDIAQNVTEWLWDFGKGLKPAPAIQTKTFHTSGDNSFTLYGKTTHGCIDTLYRPFLIYENKAFALRDTLAAFDQPVQLYSNGGTNNHYTWTPSLGLSSDTVESPVATLHNQNMTYRLDAITNEGCDAHSTVVIKRWMGPDIFIPTAFTPNGNHLNDVLHAKPVGMRLLDYFAVYDRFGKRVFYTHDFSQGWNGRVNETLADAGTYVAVARAIDYTGREIVRKVSVVLIR